MIMKKIHSAILLTILLSMFCPKAFAHDIAVENADGVMIYYNYINNGTEFEVTYKGLYGNSDNSYSGDVVIPEEVTYMNRTRKVTSIGDNALSGCSSLTSVTIPNSVTSIGGGAFWGCRSLTFVTIPNSVTSIGYTAFGDCSSLTSVTIPNSVTSIGERAFDNCRSLTFVTIGNSVTNIENRAFFHCTSLTSITIPNSVTSIGVEAFYQCISLDDVRFGNSVTSIGERAFSNCRSLISLTIPNSVTSIGNKAFAYCSSLTSITIPNSVTIIGVEAFENCTSLTSVTIPNSVTRILYGAFSYCSALTSVTIPNSVTYIGPGVFYGANLISVVSLIENPFEINGKSSSDYRTFSLNTFNNATLYVPVGTIDKYKATEGWKDFVYIVEGTGGGDTPTQKCEKPSISYSKGKLTFHSATEGAAYQYSITDSDIKSGNAQDVQLGVTYIISVYATKAGYENSETATATLCWIDVEPKTEGIENGIASIRANAVLIQSANGRFSISGVDEGTAVIVYNTAGQEVGSGKANAGVSEISTTLRKGEIGIIKIGEKAVKAMMR